MSADDGKTYVIAGPYGPGHPWYEIGFKHGVENHDAINRDDPTYMNGWADGRASASVQPGSEPK